MSPEHTPLSVSSWGALAIPPSRFPGSASSPHGPAPVYLASLLSPQYQIRTLSFKPSFWFYTYSAGHVSPICSSSGTGNTTWLAPYNLPALYQMLHLKPLSSGNIMELLLDHFCAEGWPSPTMVLDHSLLGHL